MLINPDFRMRLEEISDSSVRWLKPLTVNGFELSVQPSEESNRGVTFAPEDYERWDVAVLTPDHTYATPETHPSLFLESPWRQYWMRLQPGDFTAPNLPTEVVQTLFDFLLLGPELYSEMTLMRS